MHSGGTNDANPACTSDQRMPSSNPGGIGIAAEGTAGGAGSAPGSGSSTITIIEPVMGHPRDATSSSTSGPIARSAFNPFGHIIGPDR